MSSNLETFVGFFVFVLLSFLTPQGPLGNTLVRSTWAQNASVGFFVRSSQRVLVRDTTAYKE